MTRNKLVALLLAVLLLWCVGAQAAQKIDLERNVRLTVCFRANNTAISGATFRLFRIADVDADGKVTVAPPFDRYNVNIDTSSESAMAGLGSTLEGYVLRDHLVPLFSGTTGENGMVSFEDMEQGLYLVISEQHLANNLIYTIQPTIIQLPGWNSLREEWNYDVLINAKYTSEPDLPILPDETETTRKVLKIWNTADYNITLPSEITVHLLQNGMVYDTVKLNADNLWRHTWEGLDAGSQWNVVEDAIPNYTVSIIREGITFVITNTYLPDEPDDPTITPTPAPTPTPTPPGYGDGNLPQTGQLWWPVGILAWLGVLFILLGLLRRRGY